MGNSIKKPRVQPLPSLQLPSQDTAITVPRLLRYRFLFDLHIYAQGEEDTVSPPSKKQIRQVLERIRDPGCWDEYLSGSLSTSEELSDRPDVKDVRVRVQRPASEETPGFCHGSVSWTAADTGISRPLLKEQLRWFVEDRLAGYELSDLEGVYICLTVYRLKRGKIDLAAVAESQYPLSAPEDSQEIQDAEADCDQDERTDRVEWLHVPVA